MKEGICPKCDAAEVYSPEDMLLKGGPFGSNSIPVSLTSMAALDNYVCADCGYVESYVADEDKLHEITKKWKRVGSETATES